MRILVVEDDSKIAGFIAAGLRREGRQAETAADEAEGLRLAAASFDAPVLDRILPKRDGFNLPAELRRRAARGSGLGLSLVAAVVQARGGRVEVESVVGGGSAFIVILPGRAVFP